MVAHQTVSLDVIGTSSCASYLARYLNMIFESESIANSLNRGMYSIRPSWICVYEKASAL